MLTCNDLPVLVLSLALPVVGVWVADVQVDGDEALSGAVVLADPAGNEFKGAVYRSSLHVGRVYARILGGAGGLSTKSIAAAHYQSAQARMVLDEAAAAAGEAVDPSSDALSATLDYWSRAQGTASLALAQLADKLDVRWRVLPNGKVWMGKERADEALLDDVVELTRDGINGTVEYGLDALSLLAGDVVGGERINRLVYTQSDTAPLRAKAWLEAA